MPTKITMPQLGESVSEGTVGRWLKQEGDLVEKDEPLVEIITDKITEEMPSPYSGTLTEILVKENQTVKVGADIAVMEPSTAAPATHAPATAAPITQAPSTASTQPQTLQTRPSRTPSVRVGSGSSSSQPATHIQPQPGKDAYSLTFSKIEAERVA